MINVSVGVWSTSGTIFTDVVRILLEICITHGMKCL